MKIKLLALLVSFGAVAETVNNEYILSVPNKLYKNSITVVQSNGNGDNGIEEPITPSCGASNNGSFNFTPNQLCNVGTASSVVENTTTYNWSCTNDNITVNCSATLIPSPVCGAADGIGVDLKPTENLCEKGTASSVITANGQHTWTCESGGETESCSAEQIINTAKHSSCKAMLEEYPQLSGQDGVYPANVGGLNSSLYCNMTDQGGGWTLVMAQFESNAAGWNEGIQSDYDPSLSTSKGFALNAAQIPQHTQMSFSHSNYENKKVTNIFNYVYNSSVLIHPRVLITDTLSGDTYYIHRSATSYYGAHNPEGTGVSSSTSEWRNTLTIDKNGGEFYSFAFSYYASTSAEKGYAYKGYKGGQNDSGAWLIYVR